MHICNKVFLVNTWKSIFVFRIPGMGMAFIMLWIAKKLHRLEISLRVWKVKISIELG